VAITCVSSALISRGRADSAERRARGDLGFAVETFLSTVFGQKAALAKVCFAVEYFALMQ
jgi:hypothetical protein